MAWTTPKTNWAVGELVTAEDMNAIGENLAALRHPATAVAAYTTPAEIRRGANAEFADVDGDNLNLTITTYGGDVLVHFHGSVYCLARQKVFFDVEVDGTRQVGDDGSLRSGGSHVSSILELASFTRLIQNLGAGSHTFKLQWKITGAVQLLAGAQFWVREI